MVAYETIEVSFANRQFRMVGAKGQDWIASELQRGAYDHPKPPLLMALTLRRPGLIVDIGAGSGIYTLLAAKCTPDIKVVAIEPYAEARDFLEANVAANALDEQVSILPVALSDQPGTADLHIPSQAHGILETSSSLIRNERSEISVPVDISTIDLVIDPAVEVSLVKLSAEGNEASILRGGRHMIERTRPFVLISLILMNSDDAQQLSAWLVGIDFLVFRLTSSAAIAQDQLPSGCWAQCILVPGEELELFREICGVHSLDMVKPIFHDMA